MIALNVKRLTHDSWFEEFPWLERKDAELFCYVCRKYPTLSDPAVRLLFLKGINENYRKETLKFHNKSQKHVTCVMKEKSLTRPI